MRQKRCGLWHRPIDTSCVWNFTHVVWIQVEGRWISLYASFELFSSTLNRCLIRHRIHLSTILTVKSNSPLIISRSSHLQYVSSSNISARGYEAAVKYVYMFFLLVRLVVDLWTRAEITFLTVYTTSSLVSEPNERVAYYFLFLLWSFVVRSPLRAASQ